MPVKFFPSGHLDITSDPSLLPQETNGKSARSGAMRRCTNLRINGNGIAKTRFGSEKKSTTTTHVLNKMVEMGGVVYEFGSDEIYADETSIANTLTAAQWSTAIHRAFNETNDNIYAINGTDRKRISDTGVSEWGITAPANPLTTAQEVNYGCTYEWEKSAQVTSATMLDECDADTNWTHTPDRGTSSIDADTSNYKEEVASVYAQWPVTTAGSYLTYSMIHDFGAGSTQDWSSYSTLTFWVFRDDGSPDRARTDYLYVENSAGDKQYIQFSMPTDNSWGLIYINAGDITIAKTAIRKWGIYRSYNATYRNTMKLRVDALRGYASSVAENVLKITKTYDNSGTTAGDILEYLYSWELEMQEGEEVTASTRTYVNIWWWEIADNIGATVYIKFTYARKSGDDLLYESNPSPYVSMIPNNAAYVSWTMPSDSQVTHIRLYRTMGDPASGSDDSYYYDSEWEASLLSGQLYRNDTDLGTLLEDDHDRPPLGTVVAGPLYGTTLFIAKGNLLYFCKANQPEYWPTTYYIEVCPSHETIKAMAIWNGLLYCFTDREIYQIQGTSAANYMPIAQKAATGVTGIHALASVKGHGIYHIGRDGIYIFNGVTDQKITKARFNTLFYSETVENMVYLNKTNIAYAFLIQYKDKLYFFYPAYGETYCGNVLVIDLSGGTSLHYDYGVEFSTPCIDYTNDKLYASDSSGYVWQLENETDTTDGGTAIAWQIQSKVFSDTLYKYFPRYAKYDVDVTSGTAYGYILLNETVKQTHTISGSRNTRFRHVTGCTGDRLSLRLAGSGVSTFYSAEVE